MTLEKAIKYYEEEAKEKNYEYQDCIEVHDMENAIACGKCAEEYRQLAEWLKELKELRDLPSAQPEIIHCLDCKHHWTHSCMDAFPREICDLDQTFYDSNFDYCSLAERRIDE